MNGKYTVKYSTAHKSRVAQMKVTVTVPSGQLEQGSWARVD